MTILMRYISAVPVQDNDILGMISITTINERANNAQGCGTQMRCATDRKKIAELGMR